jgi:hypothetical protein
VSSFAHFVTRWISVVTVSCSSAVNSSHVQRATGPPGPRTVKSHVASYGVRRGTRREDGEVARAALPGGSRRAVAWGCRRPRSPRETNGSVITESKSRQGLRAVVGHHHA